MDETNGMVQDCACARVRMSRHVHERVQHMCALLSSWLCIACAHTCALHIQCVCTCVGVGVFLECVAGTGWGLGVLG